MAINPNWNLIAAGASMLPADMQPMMPMQSGLTLGGLGGFGGLGGVNPFIEAYELGQQAAPGLQSVLSNMRMPPLTTFQPMQPLALEPMTTFRPMTDITAGGAVQDPAAEAQALHSHAAYGDIYSGVHEQPTAQAMHGYGLGAHGRHMPWPRR